MSSSGDSVFVRRLLEELGQVEKVKRSDQRESVSSGCSRDEERKEVEERSRLQVDKAD